MVLALRRSWPILLAASMLAVTGACAAVTGAGDKQPPAEPGDGGQSQEQELAARATQALAQHLSVPPSTIRVLSIAAVEWPDGSLGCPQPGMSYPQVITPGYRALLQHQDSIFRVHMTDRAAIVCDAPATNLEEAKGRQQLTLTEQNVGALAAMDLARRMELAPGEVRVLGTYPTLWADSSMGCPGGNVAYEKRLTRGFVVALQAAGRNFVYHVADGVLFPCPAIDGQ